MRLRHQLHAEEGWVVRLEMHLWDVKRVLPRKRIKRD